MGTDDKTGDPRDYILDLSSSAQPTIPAGEAQPTRSLPPLAETLSIFFKCCNAYARIRITADRHAFSGHCPKCARPIRVEIDPNSPNTGRMFTAE